MVEASHIWFQQIVLKQFMSRVCLWPYVNQILLWASMAENRNCLTFSESLPVDFEDNLARGIGSVTSNWKRGYTLLSCSDFNKSIWWWLYFWWFSWNSDTDLWFISMEIQHRHCLSWKQRFAHYVITSVTLFQLLNDYAGD